MTGASTQPLLLAVWREPRGREPRGGEARGRAPAREVPGAISSAEISSGAISSGETRAEIALEVEADARLAAEGGAAAAETAAAADVRAKGIRGQVAQAPRRSR